MIGRSSNAIGIIEAEARQEVYRLLRERREIHDLEVTTRHASGAPLHLLFSVNFVSVDGAEYTLSSLLDITALKRAETALRASEEKYRTLFTSIDEGFAFCEIVLDANGNAIDYRLLDVNPAFERMTSITREAARGKTARELVPSIEDWWVETYARVALGGETVRIENRVEGLDRWFNVYASPVVGQPGRFTAVFQEVSERKRAEEALRRARKNTA